MACEILYLEYLKYNDENEDTKCKSVSSFYAFQLPIHFIIKLFVLTFTILEF